MNLRQELLLGEIDKATAWWVVQGCFKLYVGETLTEISELNGLGTCRCGVWAVISAYVGKHNYLLSWTTDAWLRQPIIGIRQYFKSKQFLQALRVSIAETLSTFTISPKGLPDGCVIVERVWAYYFFKKYVVTSLFFIDKFYFCASIKLNTSIAKN